MPERAVRSLNYRLKAARFPIHRDLGSFDFSQSTVDQLLVRQLCGGDFMALRHNPRRVGVAGTGKPRLATAMGVQAIIHAHPRVRLYSTTELVNTLDQEKATGKQGNLPRVMDADLTILDERGHRPLLQAGGALLFHLIGRLYEHASLAITAKLSFAAWTASLTMPG